MQIPLTLLEGRLKAEAQLLAKGAISADLVAWTDPFKERVRQAADRLAARVDPGAAGLVPGAHETAIRKDLEELVRQHIQASPPIVDQLRRSADEIHNAASLAAAIWDQLNVSWIPEEVHEVIDHAVPGSQDRTAALQLAREIRHEWRKLPLTPETQALREQRSSLGLDAERWRRDRERQRETLRIATAQAAEKQRIASAHQEEQRLKAAQVQAVKQRDIDQMAAEQRASDTAAKQRAEEERLKAAQLQAAKQRATDQMAAEQRASDTAAKQRAEEEELRQRLLSRPAPVPPPQPFGVSHEGAEHLCTAWMRHLGVLDAQVTQLTGDGGVDITSSRYVVQVKNLAASVPVADIRAIFGVAVADSKRALLMTSGSVSSAGLEFANRTGMALIQYNAVAGTITGLNAIGQACVDLGVDEALD